MEFAETTQDQNDISIIHVYYLSWLLASYDIQNIKMLRQFTELCSRCASAIGMKVFDISLPSYIKCIPSKAA